MDEDGQRVLRSIKAKAPEFARGGIFGAPIMPMQSPEQRIRPTANGSVYRWITGRLLDLLNISVENKSEYASNMEAMLLCIRTAHTY